MSVARSRPLSKIVIFCSRRGKMPLYSSPQSMLRRQIAAMARPKKDSAKSRLEQDRKREVLLLNLQSEPGIPRSGQEELCYENRRILSLADVPVDLSRPCASCGNCRETRRDDRREADRVRQDLSGVRRTAALQTRAAAPSISPGGISALARPSRGGAHRATEVLSLRLEPGFASDHRGRRSWAGRRVAPRRRN